MFDYHGDISDRMLAPEGAGFHPISRATAEAISRPAIPRPRRWDALAKRGLDIVLALTGLLILAGLLPWIALAIRLDSPGPIFFRQQRIGLHGRPFGMLKFRTMLDDPAPPGGHDDPAPPGLRQATRHDPRVTRVGRWLRQTSLDEWPQFANVLRGDMSVVGPRPHAPGTTAGGRLFEDIAARYPERHQVKPGLTGLAQVRGWRGETDTEQKLVRRLESDLEYIAHWSLTLDLAIVWRTVFVVLGMRNAY